MRVLSSIDPDLWTEVTNALRWLSLSLQPMTVEEVNEACIVNLNATTTINNDDRMGPDDLLTLLQGLVITRPLKRCTPRKYRQNTLKKPRGGSVTRQEEEHVELCLSHFSVKEFLTFNGNRDNHPYGFDTNEAHAFIAKNCIAYIFYYSASSEKTGTTRDLKLFPLLYYACRFWFEHARLAGESGGPLTPYIIQLLQSLPVWEDCLLVYNLYIPDNPFNCKVIRTFASALGWAAVLGLDLVAEFLLENKKEDINAYQDIGKPEGFWGLRGNGTALMKAVAFGHEKVMRVLIKKGASLDHTALHTAPYYRQENSLRILLDAGADPNSLRREDETVLDVVARPGQVQMANMLLEKGADPNGLLEPATSPLMHAVWYGSLGICKLLVAYKTDINCSSDDVEYPDALAAAFSRGRLHMVQFLLEEEHHDNITADALYYSLTGLVDGPTEDHEIICRLLVEKGANLDPIHKTFDRPLAIALYNGWEDIVKLIIAKGARIEPKDQSCMYSGNLLLSAVLTRNTGLVALLLGRGVNVDAPRVKVEPYSYHKMEETFTTPLHAAIYYLDMNMAKLILKSTPSPNSPGEPSHSLLSALAAGIMRYAYSRKAWSLNVETAEAIYLLLSERGADLKSTEALCTDNRSRSL